VGLWSFNMSTVYFMMELNALSEDIQEYKGVR
jgi:hypothetical protein